MKINQVVHFPFTRPLLSFAALTLLIVFALISVQPANAVTPWSVHLVPWGANPEVGATTKVTLYTSVIDSTYSTSKGACEITPLDGSPAKGLVFTDPYPATRRVAYAVRLGRGEVTAYTMEIEPQKPGRYQIKCGYVIDGKIAGWFSFDPWPIITVQPYR